MDYKDILSDLAEKWLLIEINHAVSKEGSNLFWELANNLFHRLYVAKGDGGRKIPQFSQLRNNLYDNMTPTVHMKIAYQSKESGEVTEVDDVTSIPVSRFPPSTYKRLYEIASVNVR